MPENEQTQTMENPVTSIPERLLALTYQNRLRSIGRHLDLNGYRSVVIVEAEGGFIVRAATLDNRTGEVLEFPNDIFQKLIEEAFACRGQGEHVHNATDLLPTGYEDFLRALGYRLDVQTARAISIVESKSFVMVNGQEREDTFEYSGYAQFEALLQAEDIRRLLDEAFRRRAPEQQQPPVSSGMGVGMSSAWRKLHGMIDG